MGDGAALGFRTADTGVEGGVEGGVDGEYIHVYIL